MNTLDALKASEIPFRINTFVDGLYDVEIGDPLNGIKGRIWLDTFSEAEAWLKWAAKRYYPDSEFAKACLGDRPCV